MFQKYDNTNTERLPIGKIKMMADADSVTKMLSVRLDHGLPVRSLQAGGSS